MVLGTVEKVKEVAGEPEPLLPTLAHPCQLLKKGGEVKDFFFEF